MRLTEPFTPIPNAILDALVRSRLSRGHWQIVIWVIRNTLGWNRKTVAFSWYQIAKEVGMDRSTVLRGGRRLHGSHLLIIRDATIAIQSEVSVWRMAVHAHTGAATHKRRCTGAPFFRRAKDNKKERYKDKERRYSAGAAHPVRGKYDIHSAT